MHQHDTRALDARKTHLDDRHRRLIARARVTAGYLHHDRTDGYRCVVGLQQQATG